ncbi:MAG: diaminopimelate epimerase [Pseudomonadota bacterium]
MTGQAEMPPPLQFRKMHGLGNDFVIIDQRASDWPLTVDLVRAIGDRHRGVGFDQLTEIRPGGNVAADLVFWNSDGSVAAACGNATRCVADLLMSESGADALSLRTERGVLPCSRTEAGTISVDMGQPSLDWADVPLARSVDTVSLPLDGSPAACSMGNPHCTFFVDDVDAVDLAGRGAEVETDPLFPQRTNVQFVRVLSRTEARVRVWERGVGVTLASGSSSCAVVVNAVRKGLMDRSALLHLDGGDIRITWGADDHVLMEGPVSYVFEGVFDPRFVMT